MLICLAAPRPATAELAQIRNADLNLIDLAQSTHPPTTPAIRSRTSISPLDRLASTHTPSPRRSNPHSARGTATPSLIAVSSLGGFPTPALRARGTVIIGPASENLHKRRHQDKACWCLGLIMTKPNYPEIDSRESESAFPPKRLHVSPSSDRNPGAFSFRRARPVAFHNGAVPRSGHPGHLWKMCGGSRQQSHGTVTFLRLSAAPRWRS